MKFKILSLSLISLYASTAYSFQLNFLHAVSGCYGGRVAPNNCFGGFVSSFNTSIYSIYAQQTRLGQPEDEQEIIAMGTAGGYMYAATLSNSIFKSLLTDGRSWSKVASNLNGFVLCMTNSTDNDDPLYFGMSDGEVFKLDSNGNLTRIAHLSYAVTAIAYDRNTDNVYIGTSNAATYLYNAGLSNLVTLTGITNKTEVTSLSINTYDHNVVAGTGQNVYVLHIPDQSWSLAGNFQNGISSVLGVHNSAYIYAATYTGHIYERDMSSTSNSWVDLGIPGGKTPIASLFGFDADDLGFINYDENVYSTFNGKFIYEGRLN